MYELAPEMMLKSARSELKGQPSWLTSRQASNWRILPEKKKEIMSSPGEDSEVATPCVVITSCGNVFKEEDLIKRKFNKALRRIANHS